MRDVVVRDDVRLEAAGGDDGVEDPDVLVADEAQAIALDDEVVLVAERVEAVDLRLHPVAVDDLDVLDRVGHLGVAGRTHAVRGRLVVHALLARAGEVAAEDDVGLAGDHERVAVLERVRRPTGAAPVHPVEGVEGQAVGGERVVGAGRELVGAGIDLPDLVRGADGLAVAVELALLRVAPDGEVELDGGGTRRVGTDVRVAVAVAARIARAAGGEHGDREDRLEQGRGAHVCLLRQGAGDSEAGDMPTEERTSS